MPSPKLIVLAALTAVMVAAPAAQANHIRPNLGLEVIAVDPATRSVQGVVHCTTPERAGRQETFKVTADIEFGQFQPGMMWGIAVDPGGVIQSTGEMPCRVSPQGPPPGPGGPGAFAPGDGPAGPHGPGPDGPHGPGADGPQGQDMPAFNRSFLNRVWKFGVEIDGADDGTLEVTIGKVMNLPKRLRAQDDELVDEAALVLFDKKVRVYDNGKRVRSANLDEADGNAVVHGKLLPPKKWRKDADGEPVPTIRARKIYL